MASASPTTGAPAGAALSDTLVSQLEQFGAAFDCLTGVVQCAHNEIDADGHLSMDGIRLLGAATYIGERLLADFGKAINAAYQPR